MKKEEHPLPPKYEFDYVDGVKKYYAFQTAAGVVYEAVFKPSGYIFPEQPLSLQQNVFEFSILVLKKPTGKLPAADVLIPNTIAAIYHHFFKNQKRVAVYICETADRRAAARVRKFGQWFEWYKGDEFFKVDLQMGSDETGQRYFTSIILHMENPDFVVIVEAFRNLVRAHTK